MTRTPIPSWAADYPERATSIEHFHLPWYCINCWRKRETVYLTPNFGPFCDECLKEPLDHQIDVVTNAVDAFVCAGGGTYDELQTIVEGTLKA